MTEPIRIGIIGTGIGLSQVMPGFLATGNAKIVALAGSSSERAKVHSADLDIPLVTGDFHDVCNSKDVDLICVTTPNEFHYEHMTAALDTDKHVFLEKPVGNTEGETQSIADHVGDKERLVIVSHQLRFNPHFQEIKKIIDSGEIGRVFRMTITQSTSVATNRSAPKIWSFDPTRGGGVRLAMGVHLVDLARFFLGRDPDTIIGSLDPIYKTRTPQDDAEYDCLASNFVGATMTFNDTTVEVSSISVSRTEEEFSIVIRGEEGDIVYDLNNYARIYKNVEEPRSLSSQEIDEDYINKETKPYFSIFKRSFFYYANVIVQSLIDGKTKMADASTIHDAVTNSRTLDALLASYRNGTREVIGNYTSNEYY